MNYKQKLDFIKKIPQYPQRSREWFAQRKGKLTSSDVATCLGINPYQKPYELFFKKLGLGEYSFGSEATLHGQQYEAEAIDKYSKLMGMCNHDFGLIAYTALDEVRTKHLGFDLSFLAGSPDGVAHPITNDENVINDLVLIEVKCPFRRKIDVGKCPNYYFPQVQLNMLILDIDKADFIEYIPVNAPPLFKKVPEMNIVRYYRDEVWLRKNIPTIINFWNSVLEWQDKKDIIHTHPDYELFMIKQGKKSEPIPKNVISFKKRKEEKEEKEETIDEFENRFLYSDNNRDINSLFEKMIAYE